MKMGFRTPSPKRSFKARTTGRATRTLKRSVNPFYGKKGAGFINNPDRAFYNAAYHRTTKGISDFIDEPKRTSSSYNYDDYDEELYYNSESGSEATTAVTGVVIVGLIVSAITLFCIGFGYAIFTVAITIIIAFLVAYFKSDSGYTSPVVTDTHYEKPQNISNSVPHGAIMKPISVKETHIRDGIYEVEKKFANPVPFNVGQFHYYKVKGKNSATGRQKTFKIAAYNETIAIEKAKKKGLLEPFTFTIADEPPTEAQKKYMQNLGLTVKSEYTKEDVMCILTRAHEGMPAAHQWLINFANQLQIPHSRYATDANVISHVCDEYFTDIQKEIAFWVYSMNYYLYGDSIYDEAKFLNIARGLTESNKFMQAYERVEKNYINPNKRTSLFKLTKSELERVRGI